MEIISLLGHSLLFQAQHVPLHVGVNNSPFLHTCSAFIKDFTPSKQGTLPGIFDFKQNQWPSFDTCHQGTKQDKFVNLKCEPRKLKAYSACQFDFDSGQPL